MRALISIPSMSGGGGAGAGEVCYPLSRRRMPLVGGDGEVLGLQLSVGGIGFVVERGQRKRKMVVVLQTEYTMPCHHAMPTPSELLRTYITP